MIRILVVDAHEHIRRKVRALVEAQNGWSVCAEVADGHEAVCQSELLQPDVVILNSHLPIVNGFDAARQIHQLSRNSKILMFTIDESSHFARAAESCGAAGFLPKAHATEHLITAILAMLRGEKYFLTAEAKRLAPRSVTLPSNLDNVASKPGLATILPLLC